MLLDKPLVFFDIETTGLRPGYHEITELAFIHEKLGSWCVRVQPKHMDRFEEEAKRVSGFNPSDWLGAPAFEEVVNKALTYMDDAIIVGHNLIKFDIPFFNGQCELVKTPRRIVDRYVIDTQTLALALLGPLGLSRLNLKACCSFFDISNAGEHNAYDDCARTKLLYEKIMANIQWTGFGPEQKELW